MFHHHLLYAIKFSKKLHKKTATAPPTAAAAIAAPEAPLIAAPEPEEEVVELFCAKAVEAVATIVMNNFVNCILNIISKVLS